MSDDPKAAAERLAAALPIQNIDRPDCRAFLIGWLTDFAREVREERDVEWIRESGRMMDRLDRNAHSESARAIRAGGAKPKEKA